MLKGDLKAGSAVLPGLARSDEAVAVLRGGVADELGSVLGCASPPRREAPNRLLLRWLKTVAVSVGGKGALERA